MSIHTLRELSTNARLFIISIPIIIALIFTSLLPYQADPTHHLADQRRIISFIPNTLDVLSNIPFIIVGLLGINELKKIKMTNWERSAWIICFFSMIGTFFGSTFYSLYPNNFALFWDRLPAIFTLSPVIAITIFEGVNKELGKTLLIPLLLLSGSSLFHWFLSNDIRYFSLSQMLSLYLIVIFPILFPYIKVGDRSKKRVIKEERIKYYGAVVLFFMLAKICESLDQVIYTLDFHMMSGHTLKHLFAAFAGLLLVSMLRRRHLSPSS